MKVIFLSENFSPLIPLINKIIPLRPNVPILANLLIDARKDGLVIKGTDLEKGFEAKIPAKVEVEGSITLPGKELVEVMSNIPAGRVSIRKDKDEVIFEFQKSTMRFNTISSDEFPSLYKNKGERVYSFKKEEFEKIFTRLLFSISSEDERPQLKGVLVDGKKDEVNFVSTDGYRMSVVKTLNNSSLGEQFILDGELIEEVSAIKQPGDIFLYLNKEVGQVIFEFGGVCIVGRMIEGKFPDYEKVLPGVSSTVAIFDREEMLKNVKLVSVFAKGAGSILTLDVTTEGINIRTRNQGVGEGSSFVQANVTGDNVTTSFNVKYVVEALKNINSTGVELHLTSTMSPALFITRGKEFCHVIMPVQVD